MGKKQYLCDRTMDKGKIKVCVGLSGGVDSSVAAYLLKQQGYDVFAMFMQNWNDASSTLHGDCEWEEDRFVAEMVARKIGIPFYFVDLSKQYRQRVVDYMFDEYAKGRTPNPDVLCNREIKFDAFLEVALKYGADYLLDIRTAVLIVRVGIHDYISAQVQAGVYSCHKALGKSLVALEGNDPRAGDD